ncbi:MAG: sensor histidine kinase [Mycobacteriales bacterium]
MSIDLSGIPIHSQSAAIGFGIPYAALSLVIWWFVTPALMRANVAIYRAVLSPTQSRAELTKRVETLVETRQETVDTQAQELRRIERDLHDGAQARLVALGMSLGLADQMMERDPVKARELLAEARSTSSQALQELRDIVRGIHPPVLADRGLDGAVRALALANPLPTRADIDIPVRLVAPVESAAYFAIAEAMTNVIKHTDATTCWVDAKYAHEALTMTVSDDGSGGADPAKGSGLAGIERRLAAFDGTLMVSSPAGGPTVVAMHLPCEPAEAGAQRS